MMMASVLPGVPRGSCLPPRDPLYISDLELLKSSRAGGGRIARCGCLRKLMERWYRKVLLAVLILMVCWNPVAAKTDNKSGSLLWNKDSRRCPMAFHEIGGKCYFYGYFPLNWFRAAEFCHSFGRGVSLASIESSQENYYIKQWLSVNGNHNTGVWIGGSDNGHNGRWAWFPTGQLVDFSNWGPSQPSGGDQHCMYMVGGLLGYQWADFHCEFDMHFICEEDVNDIEPW